MTTRINHSSGFTLIEVLVGLAVLALLVTLVQGVYSSSLRNREAAQEATETAHAAAAVTNRIADELAMAFHSPLRSEITRFFLSTSPDGFSTLEFSSRTPAISGIRPGGDTRILYEPLEDPESSENNLMLRRTELGDPYGEISRDGFTFTMMEELTGFYVECYDGEQWLDNWESVAANAPDLPRMVRIVMRWGDEENTNYMRTATTVYGQ